MKLLILIFGLTFSHSLWAKEIKTNAIVMKTAPEWLKRVRVDKVTDRIQSKLEWTIRRIQVHWDQTQADFEKVHSLGTTPSAVTIKRKNQATIHIGPHINDTNFDEIFTHELVHVIFYQKYRGAIPRWLEEGFANHLSKRKKVDYQWLARQKFPNDIQELTHPYKNSPVSSKYH